MKKTQLPQLTLLLVLGASSTAFADTGDSESPRLSLTDRLQRLRLLEEELPEDSRAEYRNRRVVIKLDRDLSLALPTLHAPGPMQGSGWKLEMTGRSTSIDAVAARVHRTHEIEPYERSVGMGGVWAGLTVMAAAALEAGATGIAAAAGAEDDAIEAMGAAGGVIAGVGLLVTIIGGIAHGVSTREVPLELGMDLVEQYNRVHVLPQFQTAAAPAPQGVVAENLVAP